MWSVECVERAIRVPTTADQTFAPQAERRRKEGQDV